MRLALLGSDAATIPLAQAAHATGRHSVVWAGDVASDEQSICDLFPDVVTAGDWQDLLQQEDVDAVYVAAASEEDELAIRLRVLAQADIALLVAHPASDEPLFYHELDMIRQDTGAVMMPLVVERWHPYIVQLSATIAGHDLVATKVEQVTLERTLSDRSKASVLRQFMQDVILLRDVCGELDRISALPAADPQATFKNLGVQMTGDAPYVIRWSVGPVVGQPGGRLTVATSRKQVVIEMGESASAWSATGSKELSQIAVEPLSAYVAALNALDGGFGESATRCDWSEACRSVELADAVEQSLRRGRAIQLHDETYTEAGVFKGLMGMAGCGLILLGLVVAVLGTTVGALLKRVGFEDAAAVVGRWPYALLVIFAVFLLMQVLRLVVPSAADQPPQQVADS